MSANSKNNTFYGLDFIITRDVLTPRPETEQLIDLVLSLTGVPYLPGVKPTTPILPQTLNILDVGTGSGCIAITLKTKLPHAHITASDISKKALKIAKKNAVLHKTDIIFNISHLLEKVKTGDILIPDLVVANLPYVDKSWPWVDQIALRSDPDLALYADDHGLALIKELLEEAATFKIHHLILEADPCQHQKISEYAKKTGFSLRETRGFILYFSS